MFKNLQRLPDLMRLKEKYPADSVLKAERDNIIKAILKGEDKRKLLILGPCSLDDKQTLWEYLNQILPYTETLKNKLFFVPRLYYAKPRSRGGFRGIIHEQNGIEKSIEILYSVMRDYNLTGADELLYPSLYPYFEDYISYTTIGARSCDNQEHRLFASGIDIPLGIKNPISGNLTSLNNAIFVAQNKNKLYFNGFEYQTNGNPFAHAILRGYTDNQNTKHMNCDINNVLSLSDIPVIIDLSHDNTGSTNYVLQNLKNPLYKNNIKGFMLESYLSERSLTDTCLNLTQTKDLLKELFDIL